MRYTKDDLDKQFPYDVSCLDLIFKNRYGDLEACPKCGVLEPKFYHVKLRKSYACKDCGYQLNPLAGTIFHKSSTPLRKWFYAMYLFSISKNGVSALELQRHIGVSYPTAHRMEKQIRLLMADDTNRLGKGGEPKQMDETYYGGRRKQSKSYDNKVPILGVLQQGGKVKVAVTGSARGKDAMEFLKANVVEGAILHTDESKIYTQAHKHYLHQSVRHVSKQWVENGVHTNGIEGFWSQLKRSLDGTYHAVSPYYLQSYVNEFAYRYNNRNVAIFPLLISKAVKPF